MNKSDSALEKVISQLKVHPEVVGVYLFGSHTRGEVKPISDIDIAVILRNPSPEVEGDIGSMYSERIDVVLFHRLPLHIQFEVLKYGRELLSKDDDYLLEIKMSVLRGYLENSRRYQRMAAEALK